MNDDLWNQILLEADKNNDGSISFEEFKAAMCDMFRKSMLRFNDRSPSKSPSYSDISPVKFRCGNENPESPCVSPLKKKDAEIISPERNPFRKGNSPSP